MGIDLPKVSEYFCAMNSSRPPRPRIDQSKILVRMLPWAAVVVALLLLWEWIQGRL